MHDLDTLGLILYAINGLTPFVFTLLLYKKYREKRKIFYLLWLAGFSAYGLATLINAYMFLNEEVPPFIGQLFTLSSLIAFISIATGVGELIKKARIFLLVSLGAPVILFLLYSTGRYNFSLDLLFMVPYLVITLALVALQFWYRANLGMAGLGWFLILIANIGYSTGNVSFTAAPFIALLGKSVVFYWMTRPRFSLITEEFEDFLMGTKTGIDQDAVLTIVETTSSRQDIQWIRNQIIDGGSKGIRSILFLTYDHLSDEIIIKSDLDLPDLYIIEMTQERHPIAAAFSESVLRISNDVDELNILIYDILDFIEAHSVKSQILFYNVSTMIEISGWKRIYTFLISMIPRLKKNEIQTFFIYSPDLHEKSFEVEILRHLGDRVIAIG
jgi:hypothetical protein